jgi:MFS superfamily sulfate permease-like transporter
MGIKEYISVWITVLITGFVSFEMGIAVGITISVVMAFVSICKKSIILFDGSSYGSNSKRHGDVLDDILEAKRSSILLYKLQSYLFFGNAPQITEIKNNVLSVKEDSFLIIDMANVSGMDYTFACELLTVRKHILEKNCWFILTGVNSSILTVLHRLKILNHPLGITSANNPKPLYTTKTPSYQESQTADYIFEDLEKAVSWCEAMLLVR